MISKDMEAEVLRLYHAEKWRIGTIAAQLGLHHTTVQRVLSRHGEGEAVRSQRPSMIDPFLPFVRQILKQYPTLRASRVYEMVRARGYRGGEDHFRHLLSMYRPSRPAEAYQRLRTLPGEQAQVDWGDFGKLEIGHAVRRLAAFVMVLSYSRQIFLRFFLDQQMANFLRGHLEAFDAFSGVPRVLLYDNLKSAVLERQGDAIRFHPELLSLASHYHFEPRPVAPARGNEKGRVERAIQYVRHAFYAAREWSDLSDLNHQAELWCRDRAGDRRWPQDQTRRVREVFAEEQSRLLSLPENPYPALERVAVKVGKTPYVRFDLNDYSVPHELVQRTLTVVADAQLVRVLDGEEVVATHERCFDRGQQIENQAHLDALTAEKRAARKERGLDRLQQAVPRCEDLLIRLAETGSHLGSATSSLLRLLERYGATEMAAAVDEALDKGAAHPQAVRHILDRRCRARRLPPPVPVCLPDNPRVRDLVVRPHALDSYDALKEEDDDDPLC